MTDMPDQRLILKLEARITDFEKAIEEQFKPALRNAIAEVVDEFLSDPVPGVKIGLKDGE